MHHLSKQPKGLLRLSSTFNKTSTTSSSPLIVNAFGDITQVRTHRGGQPIIGFTKKQKKVKEEEYPDEKEVAKQYFKRIDDQKLFQSKPNQTAVEFTRHFYEKDLTKKSAPKTTTKKASTATTTTKSSDTNNKTFAPPRAHFSQEKALHQLDQKVTGYYRGGYDLNNDASQEFTHMMSSSDHDASLTSSSGDATWRNMYEFIENVNPKMINHRAQPTNNNTSEWLFDVPPTIVHEKPGIEFSFDPVTRRRQEDYTLESHRSKVKDMALELPVFKHRPADPFAYKPHLLERLSWKNPRQLLKFCSLARGKILSPRFTGVRLRTQKKLRKEIMKARHLGLLSHSGNPEFCNPLNQVPPETTDRADVDDFVSNYENQNQLEFYLNHLKNGIVNNGTVEWVPPRSVTNPKVTLSQKRAEARGHLPEQMEKKKQLLIRYRMENAALKAQGYDPKRVPSQVLRELEEKDGLVNAAL